MYITVIQRVNRFAKCFLPHRMNSETPDSFIFLALHS